jgi:hypothetical protein
MPITGISTVLGELLAEVGGHLLDHQGERAGLLQALRVVENALLFGDFLAARLVAAELVDALRREAEVAHHRDARIGEALHGRSERSAAFEFDGLGEAFLEQAAGVAQASFDADLVAQERHVADHHGALHGATDELAVVDHLVHRHRHRGVAALHDGGHRVTDEDDIDAGAVEQAREQVVVGGQRRDALTLRLHRAQRGGRDLRTGGAHGGEP